MVESDQGLGQRGLRLARAAGREAGFDVADAGILRVRSSVHVNLPAAGVIARIEAPGAEDTARRQVKIARLLAERGGPVARLAVPENEPWVVEDGAVTLWWHLQAVAEPDLVSLGQTVKALHDATREPLPADLWAVDPCREIRALLDWPTRWSDTDESKEIRRWNDDLALQWESAIRDDPLGRAIVHGDVHRDNAILTEQGLVLVDLEDAAVGPASWDFAPLGVGVQRYGVPPASYQSFVEGYGAEPGSWEGFAAMCRAYELMSVAWAMRCSELSPAMASEAMVRVDGLFGRSEAAWTLV